MPCKGHVPRFIMLILHDEDSVEPKEQQINCNRRKPSLSATKFSFWYLDRMVGMKSIFSSALVSSHLPNTLFAAAKIEHRLRERVNILTQTLNYLLRVVVMPALAMEMVCCSMASWIATLSSSRILSNSSMQTTPPSARTMAPACDKKI